MYYDRSHMPCLNCVKSEPRIASNDFNKLTNSVKHWGISKCEWRFPMNVTFYLFEYTVLCRYICIHIYILRKLYCGIYICMHISPLHCIYPGSQSYNSFGECCLLNEAAGHIPFIFIAPVKQVNHAEYCFTDPAINLSYINNTHRK